MSEPTPPIRVPDLSERPHDLTVKQAIALSATVLYAAFTRSIDQWFAAPGSVLMREEVNEPFFFETEFQRESDAVPKRHPHYGRFLQLVPDRLVQLTWVTGAGGTEGAETVVTIELTPAGGSTHVRLTHAGFATAAARDGHEQAWPMVLEHLEKRMAELATP